DAKKSDDMKVLQLNVCSDQEVAQAAEFVKNNLKEPEKGLWGSVNTGMSAFREVEFTSSHTCKEVEDVNLWGTVRVIKVFLPHIHSHKGRVVNITSMLGRIASPSCSSYCLSSFGVAAFSDCLQPEMHRWGACVLLFEPSNFGATTGILMHDSIEAQAEELWSGASKAVQADYGKPYVTCQITLLKSFINSSLTDALASTYPYPRYSPTEAYWR
uniref:3-hydroxybutyrate dehydrogenase 1 n=1 Tax=Pelodiscus sinensis TaxID=13735 RepID=K7GEV6_PELSI